MPMETHYVFEEAKSTFVYGHFVAAIVLAAAFIEHWFFAHLAARGYKKEGSKGLAASIQCARDHKLVPLFLLDKADHLRLIRNTFVHLKSFENMHNIGQRSVNQRKRPEHLIEQDAKEALTIMYGVALHAFNHI